MLRSDLLELLPDDPRAGAVAGATRTLAELLTAARPAGWTPPDLTGVDAVAQPHCHQHAVHGVRTADRALLDGAGATVTALAGCCGLAGNFGMEQGHYDDVGRGRGERAAARPPRGRRGRRSCLADGFSCRTQVEHLAGVQGTTLVELLAARLPAQPLTAARAQVRCRAQVQLVRGPADLCASVRGAG